MSDRWPRTGRLALTQVRHQNRLFWRTPIAAFFTIVLPLVMLVLFAAIFDGVVETPDGPITQAQFYAASLAVFSAASATYTNLGISVSLQRDDGILKRVRGTPLPPWTYMAGNIGSAIWLALIGVSLMMTIGVLFYEIEVEWAKLPAAALSFVVGVACFAALGVALAAVAPTARAAPAIANATIIPLAFVSNVFIPIEDAPTWVDVVGNIFPLKHFVVAFQAAWNPFVDPPGFRWGDLAVMVLWGVIGVAIALRYFQWEPKVSAGTATARLRGRSRRPA